MTIDEIQKSEEIVLSKKQIKKMIPHRWHMLLINEAQYSVSMSNIILSKKKINCWEIFMLGHFPGNKIFPGMLLVEMIAQSAGVLIKQKFPEIKAVPFFRELSNCKFFKPVRVGDTLLIQTELIQYRADKIYIFSGQITNQFGEVVCKAETLKGFAAKI
jgi:3-hydroxymyristoyl/3-hydroxydecanoyl-(acyl carrier protein) dehydratase